MYLQCLVDDELNFSDPEILAQSGDFYMSTESYYHLFYIYTQIHIKICSLFPTDYTVSAITSDYNEQVTFGLGCKGRCAVINASFPAPYMIISASLW